MNTTAITNERERFGALLRRLRLAAGLTQSALAERAGLSERAINDLERDPKRMPRLETVTQLAKALGLTTDERTRLLAAARPHSGLLQQPSSSAPPPEPGPADDRLDPDTAARAWPLHLAPLPVDPTPFVGRVGDIMAVSARLQESGTRLLTLTGPGGIGKTRLALRVTDASQGYFADGVCFVPLASLRDPALVLPTIAAALGVPESTHHSPSQRLGEAIGMRHLLLVLDNFEQVIPAAVEIEHVLAACPRLTILITSRTVLRLAREREYAVPPLDVPDPTHLPALAALQTVDSVVLLAQCARAVVPDFALNDANAQPIAAICARLEGMPLAIRLAAARIKLLPPGALLNRLDTQLAILTGGPQDAPERQRTLRATLDWSYRLLSPTQQILFRRLAVFSGGWALEAAEGICVDNGVERVALLEVLGDLVDHSLVMVERQGGTARYRFLEPIRQYALEKLQETGEESEVRDRHLAWFLALAEEAASNFWSIQQYAWGPRLSIEYDNLLSALEWSRAQASETEAELRLAGAMVVVWLYLGHHSVARAALETALARSDPAVHTRARALALSAAGQLAGMQMNITAAGTLMKESVAIFRELGDKHQLANALNTLVVVAMHQGDEDAARALRAETLALFQETGQNWGPALSLFLWGNVALEHGEFVRARAQFEESLALYRKLGARRMAANPLTCLGKLACIEGDYASARALIEEGLAIRHEMGDKWNLAISLNSLGDVARCEGDYDRAETLFHEALTLNRQLSDHDGIGWSLHNLGHVALQTNDHRRAATFFAQSLTIRVHQDYKVGIAAGMAGFAGVALRQGQPEQAGRLFGAVEALLASIHSVLAPADKLVYDRDVAAMRAQFDVATFSDAWAAGRALALDQAIESAFGVTARVSSRPAAR